MHKNSVKEKKKKNQHTLPEVEVVSSRSDLQQGASPSVPHTRDSKRFILTTPERLIQRKMVKTHMERKIN